MTARMRSRITERAEKGLGSISFKRLLLAGGVAAFAAMLLTRILGFLPGCAGAGLLLLGSLALTHPLEGLPLALYLLRALRSLAALSSLHGGSPGLQSGSPSLLAHILQVEPGQAELDADALYGAERQDEPDSLPPSDFAYLGGFPAAGTRGLRVVDSPFRSTTPASTPTGDN